MKIGLFKFNNGNGALLCPTCRSIVMYGMPQAEFYYHCGAYFKNPLMVKNG